MKVIQCGNYGAAMTVNFAVTISSGNGEDMQKYLGRPRQEQLSYGAWRDGHSCQITIADSGTVAVNNANKVSISFARFTVSFCLHVYLIT